MQTSTNTGDEWPDIIVLAGQGTKMRNVRAIIEEKFFGKPIIDKFQDSAVVRGLGNYLHTLGDARGPNEMEQLLAS